MAVISTSLSVIEVGPGLSLQGSVLSAAPGVAVRPLAQRFDPRAVCGMGGRRRVRRAMRCGKSGTNSG